MIWTNPNLSQTFVNERIHNVHWEYLASTNKVLNETFYMEHLDKFNIEELVGNMVVNSAINLNYIIDNASEDLLNDGHFWYNVFQRDDVTLEFIEKHFDILLTFETGICNNPKVPIEFFIKYPQFQIQDFFINNNVATPQMLFDYIRQTGGYINWYKISSSSGCDETVLEL